MTDAIQKAKSKSPYVDRLNPRYAVTPGAEEKRRQAAALRFFERGYRDKSGCGLPGGRPLLVRGLEEKIWI
jgi:hypothetical protein